MVSTEYESADSMDNDFNRFLMLKREVYGNYFAAVDLDNDYYNLDYPNKQQIIPKEWIQQGIGATIPPTARNAVDNLADHILTTPHIFVPARPTNSEQQKEQDLAERKRQFLRSFWDQVKIQQGDPIAHGKKKLIKDGRVILKKAVRWDLIPDPPEDDAPRKEKLAYRRELKKIGESEFLWSITNCPTETIIEDPSDCYDPKYVYEFYKIYVADARRMYGLDDHLADYKDTDKVEYVEMWTKPYGDSPGEYVIWCKGARVHEGINPYHWETGRSTEENPVYSGYVPYVIRDSGWGEISAESKPEEKYVGILRYVHPMLETEARQLTAVDIQMRFSTFAPVITKNISEDNDAPIEIGPGKRINLMDDQEIRFESLPEIPMSAYNLINKVHDYTNELSKANILSGNVQRGVETATEADMNVRNAAAKLEGPNNSLRSAVTVMNRRILQCIENIIEAPVTVFGGIKGGPSSVSIKPSEISGYYETYVEFFTSDQAALDARNARLWADLYAVYQGVLSPQTAMEKGGIENPQEELMKASVARLFLSEPAEQVRVLMMLNGLQSSAEDVLVAYRNNLLGEALNSNEMPMGPEGVPNPQQQMRPTQEQMLDPSTEIIDESQTNVTVDQLGAQYR